MSATVSKVQPWHIAEAIEAKICNDGTPDELDQLSTHTEVDGVDVLDYTFQPKDDGAFEAQLVVYVGLHYGGQGDDGMSTSDSFPGKAEGHIADDKTIIIDNMKFDTRRFYK